MVYGMIGTYNEFDMVHGWGTCYGTYLGTWLMHDMFWYMVDGRYGTGLAHGGCMI
jgi:hypothetical protein